MCWAWAVVANPAGAANAATAITAHVENVFRTASLRFRLAKKDCPTVGRFMRVYIIVCTCRNVKNQTAVWTLGVRQKVAELAGQDGKTIEQESREGTEFPLSVFVISLCYLRYLLFKFSSGRRIVAIEIGRSAPPIGPRLSQPPCTFRGFLRRGASNFINARARRVQSATRLDRPPVIFLSLYLSVQFFVPSIVAELLRNPTVVRQIKPVSSIDWNLFSIDGPIHDTIHDTIHDKTKRSNSPCFFHR